MSSLDEQFIWMDARYEELGVACSQNEIIMDVPRWQQMMKERAGLEEDIAHMRADLQRVQDDKELKAWLKEQLRESKAHRRSADMLDMDDILHAMMARR